MVSDFLSTIGGRAAQVTEAGAAVPDRYSAAASTTVGVIAAAVQDQTQAVTGKLTQLRARLHAQAESSTAAVAAQHLSARSSITGSTATARQQLATELSGALQAIESHQAAQLLVIEEHYRAGDQRFRAAGHTVGDEAAQRGDQMALEYMRGLVDEDDSFMDGPLTYNRGKARADTAREISKGYQSGLIDEANKQADQALTGKARDIQSVRATAQHARESLQQQHAATLATIAQAETTSLSQADGARSSITTAIAQALAGGHQTLDQQQVSLTENLRAGARAQAATVEQQVAELTAATQSQVSSAVSDLLQVGRTLEARVQGAAPPTVDELTAVLAEANSQVDSGVATIVGQVDQGAALGEQQIAQGGQDVASGLAASTQTGLEGADGSATNAGGVLTSIAGSAAETIDGIQQRHTGTLATTTTAATAGFSEAVNGVQQAYDAMALGLQQGFAQSAAGLEQGLRGAVPKMEGEIRSKAEENANAVPPRWKSVVKIVLIIAVIVVVALVIGPFVIGAVGAALGTGAVMTGIIAGAIVGAATGATIQVINNWASNQPLGAGVLKAAIIGGIGGAVGGGFGAYFSSAAQAGTTVVNTAFRQFMANTAINVITETAINVVTTGHFTWEALGMAIVSAIAVGGAMHAAGGLGGVKGIQEGSMGAGERVGGAIRTGLGGTVSINYRPATPTTGQTGEEPTGTGTGTTTTEEPTGTGTGTTTTEEPTGTGTTTTEEPNGTGTGTTTTEEPTGAGTGTTTTEEPTGTGTGTTTTEEPTGTSTTTSGEEPASSGATGSREPSAQALEEAGLKPEYVDNIPPEQRGQVQDALEEWNTGANGKNQGVSHTLDYAEGAGGAGKENRLAKLSEYTGGGPFETTDPLLIPKVNAALDASVNAANGNAGQQVRVQGDKTFYFVPKDNAAPGPNGFSNGQKGLIIIKFQGKFSTFMNGNYKKFTGML